MHILVTNDDGVMAPGLLVLAQAMREIGKVSVLAPDRNWSASGHVKTLSRPLRVQEVWLADGSKALTSDGAPSDCVALALLGMVEKVDLVVSGINPYSNMGHDVTYSGTVTAAMEAVIADVPGVAFSLAGNEHLGQLDYAPAGIIAQKVITRLLQHGLRSNFLLNVNVPVLPIEKIGGFRITRQGLSVYQDELDKRFDPRGQPYYWIGGDVPTGIPDEGTDFGAIAQGYVSITPLQLDLTAYRTAQELSSWLWQ